MQLSGSGRRSLNLGKGFMENFCDIKETNDVSIFVTDGLKRCLISDPRLLKKTAAYQMPEMLLHHQL